MKGMKEMGYEETKGPGVSHFQPFLMMLSSEQSWLLHYLFTNNFITIYLLTIL